MRKRKQLFAACLLMISAVAVGSIMRRGLRGTNARVAAAQPTRVDHVEPQAVVLLTAREPEDAAAATAARPHEVNSRSIRDLQWTFGGKPQRGWHLYAPLIAELIDSNDPPASLGFAATLARWQGAAGLTPTGVINEETMMSMVKAWQEKRSTDRTYPTEAQLVTAGATEFYDPARVAPLRQVERTTYAAYRRMLRAALADKSLGLGIGSNGELAPHEKRLRIVSAFRSREYQAQLRKQSPHSGRAGLAVNSPHFTGRALDLYIAGEPVETKDSNRLIQVEEPVYRWLVRNAGRFGFRPYFYEPWHWEYDPTLDEQNRDAESVRQRFVNPPANGVVNR